MDYCSYFIKDKALFGSYPTLERARELVDNGVSVFIDLTTESEKTTLDKYYDNINDITYINYEIIDRRIPTNIQEFTLFIIRIMNIIKTHDQKIYIHCKGGHGRAGIVVACLLCFLYNVTPQQSLEMTTKFHSTRKMMRKSKKKSRLILKKVDWIEHGFTVMIFLFMEWMLELQKIWSQIVMH